MCLNTDNSIERKSDKRKKSLTKLMTNNKKSTQKTIEDAKFFCSTDDAKFP